MGELWIPLLSSKSFFIVLIAQKKNSVSSAQAAKKTFAHEIEAIGAT